MSQRSLVLALATSTALACGAEPASSVEVRQTVAELVDLGRALGLEQSAVALSSELEPSATPEALAARLSAELGEGMPCASLTSLGEDGLRIDFGAVGGACDPAEPNPDAPGPAAPNLAGAVRIVFSAPSPEVRVAAMTHLDLERDGSRLNGTTLITWGPQGTLRVISELRLASASERQLEIQADRVQFGPPGKLGLDGWHRWQTLMGNWEMELGGWTLRAGELVPVDGVASIDTPFEHDIYIDFTGEVPGGLGLRVNGGRKDHVFVVDASGEIVDVADP